MTAIRTANRDRLMIAQIALAVCKLKAEEACIVMRREKRRRMRYVN